MKTIQLCNASRPLSEYARELKGEMLVVKDASEPVAAIVPLKAVPESDGTLTSSICRRSDAYVRRDEESSVAQAKCKQDIAAEKP